MTRDAAQKRAEALVAKMTIEEKASQLSYNSAAVKRLNIPYYNWWNEALHGVARAGVATSFPQAIAMAATFDVDLLGRVAEAIATEGRAKYNTYSQKGDRDIYKGLTFWSPNVNIFRDPRWGRGHETYGEDPFLTSRLGVAFVEGLQGDGPYLKAAACAKHFAVHSGPEAERHYFDAITNDKDLYETYLPAFHALVTEAKVESVMGAYNRTNGDPCCAHPRLMQDILRDDWGFEGHYVSDCWAIKDFHENHKVTKRPEESAALAINTGCDLNCGNTYLYILKAFEAGLVEEKTMDESVVRLLTSRFLLGLFDENEFDTIAYDAVECQEHLSLANEVTAKSLVLLKNNGLLPLKSDEIDRIGVVGPNANSRAALIGNYHGTSSRYITLLEGVQDTVLPGTRVFYSEGSHLYKDRIQGLGFADDRIQEALIVGDNSDVLIVSVGLDETLEGEEGDTGNSDASGDKNDLFLPKSQRKLLDALRGIKKPKILCVNAGSALDISEYEDDFDAILLGWYPGARGGKVMAEALFGQVAPSGKLPVTFYYNDHPLPDFTDYSMKGRTYRYIEGMALYPFGYGLTYGKASIIDAKIVATRQEATAERRHPINRIGQVEAPPDHKISVKLQCQAVTGDQDYMEEVLQVYMKPLNAIYAPLNPKLVAFGRVHMTKDQVLECDLIIEGDKFYSVNEQGAYILESDTFEVFVGFGQPDLKTSALYGQESFKLTHTL